MITSAPRALNICYVSTAPPRRCGIATYTSHLSRAVSEFLGGRPYSTLALIDPTDGDDNAPGSEFRILREKKSDYVRAARYINRSAADVVNLHHEFALFGGICGHHASALLRNVYKPVVTTCHTILDNPDEALRCAFQQVLDLSDGVICMSPSGSEILKETYGVPQDKIRLIDHGVPDLPFVDPNTMKKAVNLQGKMVLLTFGLLSPNKGPEVMIRAMPRVVKRFPEAVYLVLGQTHPAIRREHGEDYRTGLERMVRDFGLERNVIFHDRFLDDGELLQYLLASDICITPYLDERQTSSGVLSLALAAGKAVVASPFRHARDLLGNGGGVLVNAGDSDGLADGVIRLLENDDHRNRLREKAYRLGRSMTWEAVAGKYLQVFEEMIGEGQKRLPTGSSMKKMKRLDLLSADLFLSSSLTKRRLGRILDLARRHQWRAIAQKVVKTLNPFSL
jgi:glycosyltransferase involved in cell wall biosynthesis